MNNISIKAMMNPKEKMIQKLLKMKRYKSSDNRQLYELTLPELENEYKIVESRNNAI